MVLIQTPSSYNGNRKRRKRNIFNTKPEDMTTDAGPSYICDGTDPEVGIYKGKQENKNSTKQAIKKFIKENNKLKKQENKNSTKKAIKKTRNQELDQEKKKKLSYFLEHFLGRVLVFLFLFSYFLLFFYKFPPQILSLAL